MQHNTYIGAQFYVAVIMLLKSAILLDLLHLFVPRGTKGRLWWAIQITLWLNNLYYTSVIVIEISRCKPQRKNWDPTVAGTCASWTGAWLLISGVLNLASDIVILVLPQEVIWSLHMDRKKRFGVSALFAIGILYVLIPDNAGTDVLTH